jgi:hypothetical protein
VIIISDLDNCLCDDSHRYHLLPPPEAIFKGITQEVFDPYHAEMVNDSVNNTLAMKLTTLYEAGHTIVYSSARPNKYREVTSRWLYDNGLWFPDTKLYLRADDCLDSAVVLKAHHLSQIWTDFPEGVALAFDDRFDVCMMYQAAAVPVIQHYCRMEALHEWPL